jgi:divalent metal cation (Fe/Co/Zn/Cd) transporter
MSDQFRRTLFVVAGLNVAYFGIEFAAAIIIGSVSLFADSIDFLEDAALNVLILIAIGWSAPFRTAVGKLLAVIIVIPGLATLWMTWHGEFRSRTERSHPPNPGRSFSPTAHRLPLQSCTRGAPFSQAAMARRHV